MRAAMRAYNQHYILPVFDLETQRLTSAFLSCTHLQLSCHVAAGHPGALLFAYDGSCGHYRLMLVMTEWAERHLPETMKMHLKEVTQEGKLVLIGYDGGFVVYELHRIPGCLEDS